MTQHIVVASLLMFVFVAYAESSQQVLRVSHGIPTQVPIGKLISGWADRVRSRAGDELHVVEFPSNQLLRAKSEVTAVSRGHVQSAIIANMSWGLTDPNIAGLLRPFSFGSYGEFTDFLDYANIESSQHYADLGVRRLGWIWIGSQAGFTSNTEPLDSAKDFEDVKIRGLDGLINAALIDLGAAPVTMSGGEAFQALQTNLINASITTVQAVHQRRYFEVQDWCVVAPMYATAFGVYVNEAWWNAQSASVQRILKEETATLEAQSVLLSERELAELPELIRNSGMHYKTMAPKDVAILAAKVTASWDRAFIKETGADGERFLEKFTQWRMRAQTSQ